MVLNYRLVLPRGKGVNDSIDPNLCSLKYITIRQVAIEATSQGKGKLITKIDIKAAYCLIPVAPNDFFKIFWDHIRSIRESSHHKDRLR